MILLLGGTTEAKQVAAFLEDEGLAYIYSTRTKVNFQGRGDYIYGSMDRQRLAHCCTSRRVRLVIDACHPFAAELHETVSKIAAEVPVVRFEREFGARILHPLVSYVQNYQEMLDRMTLLKATSMLGLTGVQSIPLLHSFWQQYPAWFRILERPWSIDFAAAAGFPAERLLFGLPQEQEAEAALLQKLRPAVILTKESGHHGKLDAKIQAAVACKIPILVLRKPDLPAILPVVHTLTALIPFLRYD